MNTPKLEKVLKYILSETKNLDEVYDFIKVKPIISMNEQNKKESELSQKTTLIKDIAYKFYLGKFFTCAEFQLKMLDFFGSNYGHKVTGSILRSLFHRKIRKVNGKASYYYYCSENFTNE